MNIEYATQIAWSPEDGAYIALAAELPGCFADGQTPEEAMANLRVVIKEWIEVAVEEGRPVPPPITVEDFARLQIEAQANLHKQIEQEVKKIVHQVLQALMAQQPPVVGWSMRGGLAVDPSGELVVASGSRRR